ALAAVAVEFSRALDLFKFILNARNSLLDQPPVGLELALARATEEAKAAALALKMGPGAHQPALLIGQMRVLDLQRTLAGVRAPAEDFENEPGAVEHLCAPSFFQIALLHRRERAIDDHDAGLGAFDQAGDLLDLALADEGGGADVADRHNTGLHHFEVDRLCEPDRFIKLGRGRAQRRACRYARRHAAAHMRLDDERATAAGAPAGARPISLAIDPARLQLDLVHGRRFLGAFKQLDRMTRHNRRDGVLVDELRMAVAPQQHAEIIEPGDNALQFHSVHQEDGERSFTFSDVIEEGVLQILRAVCRHCRCSVFRSRAPSRESYCQASPPRVFCVLFTRTWAVPLQGTSARGASI